jgi:DNA-binding XRE family transcriptional regulator/rRNA-processing protein FCF1
MIDFYENLRQKILERMQISLRQVRQILGLGVQEFGDIVGLTRQTINNLETQKNKISPIQYIAICALIDNYIQEKPELIPVITTILHSNNDVITRDMNKSIKSGLFSKKWFMCFPDKLKISKFSSNIIPSIEIEEFNELAKDYRIFLDNTILLDENFQNIIQSLILSMRNNENKFIVPLKVIEEIQEKMMEYNENDINCVKNAMDLLTLLQKEEVIDIRGEKTDINIMRTFISVFTKFKSTTKLAIITCNFKLIEQIKFLNNIYDGFEIVVLTPFEDGEIKKWLKNSIIENNISINDDNNIEDNSIQKLEKWQIID